MNDMGAFRFDAATTKGAPFKEISFCDNGFVATLALASPVMASIIAKPALIRDDCEPSECLPGKIGLDGCRRPLKCASATPALTRYEIVFPDGFLGAAFASAKPVTPAIFYLPCVSNNCESSKDFSDHSALLYGLN
jgi:hypothetical protein